MALHHPALRSFVLIIDPFDGYVDPDREPFEVVRLSDLSIQDTPSLCMRYSLTELATAVKPYLLEYVFDRLACRSLLFLDPDILVLNTLQPLYERLRDRSILLTPHITEPIEDDASQDERVFLQGGLYNLGFLGLSATKTTRRMLSWWKRRLRTACVLRPDKGLFVDQKWMDLVPLLFDHVELVTDPGYNVAYWNLHERRIQLRPKPRVNGKPLRFFHFSGYDPHRPETLSKYQDRFVMSRNGAARRLLAMYRNFLLDEGYTESSRWPYAHDYFDNGVRITPIMRDLYESLGERQRWFDNPFDTRSERSFFRWMNAPVNGGRSGPPSVSNLLYYLWSSQPYLRGAFRWIAGRDREPFLAWVARHMNSCLPPGAPTRDDRLPSP